MLFADQVVVTPSPDGGVAAGMARSSTATAAWPRSPDSHGSPQSQVHQQHARLLRCSTPPADSLHNTLFAAIRHRIEQQDSSSQCVLSSPVVETSSATCSSVSVSMPIVRPSAQAWKSSEGSGFAGNISNNYKFTHTFKLCRICLNTNENKHYNCWLILVFAVGLEAFHRYTPLPLVSSPNSVSVATAIDAQVDCDASNVTPVTFGASLIPPMLRHLCSIPEVDPDVLSHTDQQFNDNPLQLQRTSGHSPSAGTTMLSSITSCPRPIVPTPRAFKMNVNTEHELTVACLTLERAKCAFQNQFTDIFMQLSTLMPGSCAMKE